MSLDFVEVSRAGDRGDDTFNVYRVSWREVDGSSRWIGLLFSIYEPFCNQMPASRADHAICHQQPRNCHKHWLADLLRDHFKAGTRRQCTAILAVDHMLTFLEDVS